MDRRIWLEGRRAEALESSLDFIGDQVEIGLCSAGTGVVILRFDRLVLDPKRLAERPAHLLKQQIIRKRDNRCYAERRNFERRNVGESGPHDRNVKAVLAGLRRRWEFHARPSISAPPGRMPSCRTSFWLL